MRAIDGTGLLAVEPAIVVSPSKAPACAGYLSRNGHYIPLLRQSQCKKKHFETFSYIR
jgi:hypothetical protein